MKLSDLKPGQRVIIGEIDPDSVDFIRTHPLPTIFPHTVYEWLPAPVWRGLQATVKDIIVTPKSEYPELVVCDIELHFELVLTPEEIEKIAEEL